MPTLQIRIPKVVICSGPDHYGEHKEMARTAKSPVMENWIRAPVRNGFHLRLLGCKKCSCHETVSRSDGRSQRKSAVTRCVNDCKFVCGKSDPSVRCRCLNN